MRKRGPAVLFAAAALAFLLPFGTVSCGNQTVSFTGLELATMHVPPDPVPRVDPSNGLSAHVEAQAGAWALLALVLVVGGLVSAVALGRGGGFAFGSGLALCVLLFDAATTGADARVRGGLWLALTCIAGAGAMRARAGLQARRLREESGSAAPPRGSPGRRFARRGFFVAGAAVVLLIGSALAPNTP
jgi:hypothetical protein